jgi:hypothetical protein
MATAYQISLMAHSLGGRDPKKWHRNYFVADDKHSDYDDLCALEEEGMMKRIASPSFMGESTITFVVTENGKDFFR